MGLIKAALGAAGGTLADTWKEFFYCDSLDKNTLMVRGQKQITGRSSNTKGNDNIISNGSGIAVADGQCMIIVDQGKVVEVCAEPGEFTYDTSSEPSLFAGSLGESIKATFKTMVKRIGYGGDTGKDQRVYYFNTKEILDNKFGTPNPIPFRVVDRNINLDMDMSIRCSGVYSYKIADPILFYTNVCGNVSDEYRKDELDTQLKTEFLAALQPAMGQLSNLEIRPNQIVTHNLELQQALNEQLSTLWGENRGIVVANVALGSVTLTEEDQAIIKEKQAKMSDAATYSNVGLAAGMMAGAQADAMKAAASNQAGAMNGFVGMGMAMNQGGTNASSLFGMAAQQQAAQQAAAPQAAQAAPAAGGWTCSCGAVNSGNFCSSCGAKKPEAPAAKFCPQCGTKLENPGKFCPNCGAQLQ